MAILSIHLKFLITMDEILKTLYLHLDSNTSYLLKNAECQLLMKLVYKYPKASVDEIYNHYGRIARRVDQGRFDDLVQHLLNQGEIEKKKGHLDLSRGIEKKIKKALLESQERFQRMVTSFEPYFSDKQSIEAWLFDTMVIFFKTFSDDWISDLCHKTDTFARRKDSVLGVIQKRTLNNKNIDKRDKEALPRKFLDLILRREPDVANFLWEYGTSAFSASLIENSYAINELTFSVFKDSYCVLDTNILMHIGLEGSIYYESLKILEEVFLELGMNASVLYITQREYISAVGFKRDQVLKVAKSYDLEVLKQTDDQYLKTAIARGCTTEDDFQEFFGQLLIMPSYINENVPISLLDNDKCLEDIISSAQKDEEKRRELNAIFKGVKGYDKKEYALVHDVGLIGGISYLRDKGKYFILSQEVSVNAYAKKKPLINGLPIAIHIDTLLNVLALNGGALKREYKTLFADIIREGLQPSRDTFTVPDLSIMLDKNDQISKLPPEKVAEIAQGIHNKRLLGASDRDITVYMTREIQGAKLEVMEDLAKVKLELSSEVRDKEHFRQQATKGENALRRKIEKEVRSEYKVATRFFWGKRIALAILIPVVMCLALYFAGVKEFLKEITLALFFACIGGIYSISRGRYRDRKRSKKDSIKEEVDRRLQDSLNKES